MRYLKYFDFSLVREALRERSRLLKLSPHTVRPLRFEMHLKTWSESLFYGLGIGLYDLLAAGHHIGQSRYFGKTLSYWDAASDSAPLVIDNIRDARAMGASCWPYTEVAALGDDHVLLASGEKIMARVVVDARGPWRKVPGLRLVRGSHIVSERLYAGDHAIAHFHSDGRILFFIPWGDRYPVTLIGTTEADHAGTADDVAISEQEREYLCNITRGLFPHFRPEMLVGEFSSLRPLVAEEGKNASATSREHNITFDANGILFIEGGKYTTYRLMAEQAADKVLERVRPSLAGFYPTRTEAFRVNTQRPTDLAQRLQWAQTEEGCRTADDFLTCSTNWAWQKPWTAAERAALEEAFRH
ncbi:MAG: hypothetical protein OHK0021_01980 [Bryobacter sp.]